MKKKKKNKKDSPLSGESRKEPLNKVYQAMQKKELPIYYAVQPVRVRLPNVYFCAKTNRWCLQIQRNKTRKSFYSSAKSYRKARKELEDKALIWLQESTTSAHAVTTRQALNQYQERSARTKKSWTQHTETLTLNRIFSSVDNVPLASLRKGDFISLWRAVSDGKKIASARNYGSIMINFLKWCASQDFIEDHAVPLFLDYSLYNSEKQEKKTLSREMLATLLASPLDRPDLCVVIFLATTGLRLGEFLALRVCDLSVDGLLSITASIDAQGNRQTPKTKQGVRCVPLPQVALDALNAYRAMMESEEIPESPLFASDRGKVLTRSAVRSYCQSVSKRLFGLTFSPHELRHTFITHTRKNTALPLTELKVVYGHSEAMRTDAVYTHELERTAEEIRAEQEQVTKVKNALNDVFEAPNKGTR